jgi:glutaryl-CoA dehydrogenase
VTWFFALSELSAYYIVMEDFLQLESQLSDDERLVRDTVRRFVDEQAAPLMADAFEKGEYPQQLTQSMAELGLFGLTLPEQYGGAGANYITYGLVCQELERGDSGLRSFVSVQSSLCMYPIYIMASEEQKQHFLPLMARGELIGCYGLTEPDAGSDPNSMQTTATKVDGGYILNGTKMWITNAPIADIAVVWAKLDGVVRGFIVERDFEGFKTNEVKHKASLRASVTGEIILQDCFVPESHILPGSEKGLGAALGCLTQARYGIAWGAIGAAMACYESALDYAKNRKQFGKAIASFQLIQKDLVDMLTEISKAQTLNLQLGRLFDQNREHFSQVSMAKMNACREALKIARMARNILGANGISLEYPVIRHMNNLESVFTYEGTDNIHHLIIGREITGIAAF